MIPSNIFKQRTYNSHITKCRPNTTFFSFGCTHIPPGEAMASSFVGCPRLKKLSLWHRPSPIPARSSPSRRESSVVDRSPSPHSLPRTRWASIVFGFTTGHVDRRDPVFSPRPVERVPAVPGDQDLLGVLDFIFGLVFDPVFAFTFTFVAVTFASVVQELVRLGGKEGTLEEQLLLLREARRRRDDLGIFTVVTVRFPCNLAVVLGGVVLGDWPFVVPSPRPPPPPLALLRLDGGRSRGRSRRRSWRGSGRRRGGRRISLAACIAAVASVPACVTTSACVTVVIFTDLSIAIEPRRRCDSPFVRHDAHIFPYPLRLSRDAGIYSGKVPIRTPYSEANDAYLDVHLLSAGDVLPAPAAVAAPFVALGVEYQGSPRVALARVLVPCLCAHHGIIDGIIVRVAQPLRLLTHGVGDVEYCRVQKRRARYLLPLSSLRIALVLVHTPP
mmetsp:Transcript_14015/g.41039  ORF Transcript_14015/g.41039 Transcript_14015/m.41039 type:complete len:443 (-) Transcript_14015:143-1471(-)